LIIKSLKFLKCKPVKRKKNITNKQWKGYLKEIENYNEQNERYYSKSIITHEMTHVFFQLFYNATKPAWINEGLASIVGGVWIFSKKKLKEEIIKHHIGEKDLIYRYMKRDWTDNKLTIIRYNLWKKFIIHITKNNPSKILEVLEKYHKNPSKKLYEALFIKKFGKPPEKLFKEFISTF